jgi:hypothetical protein
VTGIRLVRTVDAVAVHRARPGRWQIAIPYFIGVFGKLDTFEFGRTGLIE